jgi:hypothetical protein
MERYIPFKRYLYYIQSVIVSVLSEVSLLCFISFSFQRVL